MKKFKFYIFIVTFILSFVLFIFQYPLNADALKVSAQCAVTIEASTGIVLSEINPDKVRPMASTTKIMTALVALENASLDDIFKVTSSAALVDGSQLGLVDGDEIILEDLLYMMMLKSANDAAETIAQGVAGSLEAFVELMNKKAREIGCVNTNFANPHGMPNDNHYTTAKELAMITREAMKNDTFREIVGTDKKKLQYHGLVIDNSNRLLEIYTYADGVKTGFTKKAGRCLVSSATKDGVTLITVTLNAGDDWNDHIKLYEHNFTRVKAVELIPAGEYEASRPSLNGKTRTVVTNSEALIGVEIDGKLPYYEYSENLPKFFFAPIQKMKVCGSIYLMYNNLAVSKSPLYCPHGVEQDESEKGFWGIYAYYFKIIMEKVLF